MNHQFFTFILLLLSLDCGFSIRTYHIPRDPTFHTTPLIQHKLHRSFSGKTSSNPSHQSSRISQNNFGVKSKIKDFSSPSPNRFLKLRLNQSPSLSKRIQVSQASIPLISKHARRRLKLSRRKILGRSPRSLIVSHHHALKRRHGRRGNKLSRRHKKSRLLRSAKPYKFKEILTDKNKETLSIMMNKIKALKNLNSKNAAPATNQDTQVTQQTQTIEGQKPNRKLTSERPKFEAKMRNMKRLKKHIQHKKLSIII